MRRQAGVQRRAGRLKGSVYSGTWGLGLWVTVRELEALKWTSVVVVDVFGAGRWTPGPVCTMLAREVKGVRGKEGAGSREGPLVTTPRLLASGLLGFGKDGD